MIEAPLENENLENNLTVARSERPSALINEWGEHENISGILNNTERLSDPILEEPEIKLRNLNPLYNFENISSAEMNKDGIIKNMLLHEQQLHSVKGKGH